jgi:hypothetical protein
MKFLAFRGVHLFGAMRKRGKSAPFAKRRTNDHNFNCQILGSKPSSSSLTKISRWKQLCIAQQHAVAWLFDVPCGAKRDHTLRRHQSLQETERC